MKTDRAPFQTADKPISLQVTQLRRQHVLCDLRYCAPQFSEAVNALIQ